MSVLSGTLGMGRSMAEARFTETLTFFSEALTDPPEGQIDPVLTETPLYVDIPGRVKFPSLTVADREQAGQLVAVQSPEVHVAVGAVPLVVEGVFVRVTASTADASLVGRKYRIDGDPAGGQTTAHRYPVSRAS